MGVAFLLSRLSSFFVGVAAAPFFFSFFKPNLTSTASRSESVPVAVGSVGLRFCKSIQHYYSWDRVCSCECWFTLLNICLVGMYRVTFNSIPILTSISDVLLAYLDSS